MTVTKNSTKNYVGRFVKRRGAADSARNTRENIFVQNTLAICCCCGGGCCCCCCCCCGRLKDFFLKSGKPFILLLCRWRKRLHSNTLRLWRRCPPRGCRAFTCYSTAVRTRYLPQKISKFTINLFAGNRNSCTKRKGALRRKTKKSHCSRTFFTPTLRTTYIRT